jgi:endo-1,3-1,4-beta-glycanase ExoK
VRGRTAVAIALAATVFATSSACAQQAPPKPVVDAGPSFFEPFDRINTSRWYVSDGWVNGDYHGCTWSRLNLAISKGVLQLHLGKAKDKLRPLRCAEIRTHERHGHGVYEARIRTAAGSGLNTAMFTYSGPPLTNVHDEIDFEFLGKSPQSVQLNYYVGKVGGRETAPFLGFDASAGFHDYAFVWMPDRIEWYIDGKLVRRADGAQQPVTPGQFFLSLWNGSSTVNDWLGAFDATRTPVMAEIDWIGFTKAGERCKFPASISCKLPV